MNIQQFIQPLMNRQFFVFLSVGLATMAVQFLSFSLFAHLALPSKIAVSGAYVLAVLFHFLMNRTVTFKAKNSDVMGHLGRYLVVVCINYVVTLLVFDVIVTRFSFSPYIGMAAAIAATVMTGFFLLKFWVFHTAS